LKENYLAAKYQKDGITRRMFECRAQSILQLDRAARQETPAAADDDA
jgi:hypothetical protein